MDGWVVGWMDGWVGGWMDGWVVGWMGGWIGGRLNGNDEWIIVNIIHESSVCIILEPFRGRETGII